MSVRISQAEGYLNYGRCLKMENGSIEALITVDVGPRIISLSLAGGENMFFNDVEQARVTKNELYESVFGKGAEYHFYGGHRMWLAPQTMIHTMVPDNDPVPYEIVENGVILRPLEQKVHGLRPEMRVVMDPVRAEIAVTVTYTNVSDRDRSYAVWQISQFDRGGLAIIPVSLPRRPFDRSRRPTEEELLSPLMPMGQVTNFMGGFGDDPRLRIDSAFMTLRQDPAVRSPIKMGTPNLPGYAMYANKGCVAVLRSERVAGKTYTDLGCGLETYTDSGFLELEMLGPYETFAPGSQISLNETIELKPMKLPMPDPEDRAAVRAFAEAHLG